MVPAQVLVSFPVFLPPTMLLTVHRLYMADGFYQSIMCFFMPYCLYQPATFEHPNGLNINDRMRIGVLVAAAAVIASNTYIMLNTYRWDWITVLINAISSLLVFFWTGIYSSFAASGQFYKAAAEVYGALSFWAVLLLTVTMCLLPRFAVKAIQKVYFPRDVDIIREQVTMGKFKYLDQFEAYVPPSASAAALAGVGSATSSDLGKPIEPTMKRDPNLPEDERPIYPPSVAPTGATHNHNGSNGTNYTSSLEYHHQHQHSLDQVRSSFDRNRPSVDYTSGAALTRVESINAAPQSPHSPLKSPRDPPSNPV